MSAAPIVAAGAVVLSRFATPPDLAPQRPVAVSAIEPALPLTEISREEFEAIAAELRPTGTLFVQGRPNLVMGSKRFEVGTKFVVSLHGRNFEMVLNALDRTTFTVTCGRQSITRPIKSLPRS